jgi:hypothetical protein
MTCDAGLAPFLLMVDPEGGRSPVKTTGDVGARVKERAAGTARPMPPNAATTPTGMWLAGAR